MADDRDQQVETHLNRVLNVRSTRNAQTVRAYLVNLPDSHGNSKSGNSLEGFAREFDLQVADLTQFRDGRDDALSTSMVTALAKVMGSDGAVDGHDYDHRMDRGGFYRFTAAGMSREDDARMSRYEHYELIDRTRPEAHSACNAWADLGITGGLGGEQRRPPFRPEYYGADEAMAAVLKEIEENVNTRLLPNEQKLQAFRGMAKFGDQWGELALAQRDGQTQIVRVAPRHARTMYVNRTEDGSIDETEPYIQRLPSDRREIAKFAHWKIMRLCNRVEWGAVYGESIFEPCLRSYIQLEAMEVSMIVRRLTRAPLRYHHILDVGHLHADEIDAALERRRLKLKKRATVEVDGKIGRMGINLPTEEDMFSGKKDQNSPSDIKRLEGDENIGEIADFVHFFDKWLSGLGPPKAHLGYENNTMRSVITDLHIVFARKVRHMQMKFIAGLNHLYWVSLVLRGIDPRTVPYLIVPPTMGTRDELIRAQIMQMQATTLKYMCDGMGITGQAPSPKWLIKWVMGMPDEATDQLELLKVVKQSKGAMKNDPGTGTKSSDARSAEIAAQFLQSDDVAKQATLVSFLVGERAIAMRKEGALNIELNPFKQQEMAPVASHEFEAFCNSLGKHEWQLRSAA